MEEWSPRARACSHYYRPRQPYIRFILCVMGLREATHAARSIIMQGWNGPLGCYLHLSVFPATSNLLMIIKEQRGPAALWKQAPASPGNGPCIHNHPELKPLFDKNQEKLAGRLPRTTCKPPPPPAPSTYTTPGWDGYSKYKVRHAGTSKILLWRHNFRWWAKKENKNGATIKEEFFFPQKQKIWLSSWTPIKK